MVNENEPPLTPVRAGILVGGSSRRMGRPKQLVELRGRTLLEHVIAALEPYAEGVVLLGGGPLPDSCTHFPRLPDPTGLAGPLAGMLGAMRSAPEASWIFAGCDQPLVSRRAVEWLLQERRPGAWAVLPRLDSRGVEPLLAVYEARARDLLEALASSGRLSPSALAGHARTHSPVPPPDIAGAWRNVNTPEDLKDLESGRRTE